MILPRMTNKHYPVCLCSAGQPQDGESVLWISTFPTPSREDANAFASYFNLLCSLSVLQPLCTGEAVRSNRCLSLPKGKLPSLRGRRGYEGGLRVAWTFEVHSQDDLIQERPMFKRVGSTCLSRKAAQNKANRPPLVLLIVDGSDTGPLWSLGPKT